MNRNSERTTEAPAVTGDFQQVSTIREAATASTNVQTQQLRTVSTTVTKGEITLRYTPREPSSSQNTNS
jgi:hypothetical protein